MMRQCALCGLFKSEELRRADDNSFDGVVLLRTTPTRAMWCCGDCAKAITAAWAKAVRRLADTKDGGA